MKTAARVARYWCVAMGTAMLVVALFQSGNWDWWIRGMLISIFGCVMFKDEAK